MSDTEAKVERALESRLKWWGAFAVGVSMVVWAYASIQITLASQAQQINDMTAEHSKLSILIENDQEILNSMNQRLSSIEGQLKIILKSNR